MDTTLSLAVSMQSNKGVYALLLGSGISYSAEIKTGWGILEDLCAQLQVLQEEPTFESKPVEWYEKTYGMKAKYDDILEQLAGTSSERNGLLEQYFIPTEEEAEKGVKTPTKAHRSIAKLVKKGYIRVIITTNFDRLIEKALEDEGVNFQSVYDVDAIKGMKPLVHKDCTVIKVHGDYKDTRFKNIQYELSEYPKELNALLEQIFDEYGVIVSGWSAQWDTALRGVIKRTKSRRYSWYWTSLNDELAEEAREIVTFRDATLVADPNGADSVFTKLLNNAEALETFKQQKTLTYEVTIAKTKNFISKEQDIDLNDLIMKEIKKIRSFIENIDAHDNSWRDPSDGFRNFGKLLDQYVNVAHNLSGVLSTVSFYGNTDFHQKIIIQTLERLTEFKRPGGIPYVLDLQILPAILVFYASGVAAATRENYAFLNSIICEPNTRDPFDRDGTFLEYVSPGRTLGRILDSTIYKGKGLFLPANEFLFNNLMESLNHIIISKEEYEMYFDRFEFLLTLKDIYEEAGYNYAGRFSYKPVNSSIQNLILKGKRESSSWGVLSLFDQSSEKFLEALKKLQEDLQGDHRFYVDFLRFYQ